MKATNIENCIGLSLPTMKNGATYYPDTLETLKEHLNQTKRCQINKAKDQTLQGSKGANKGANKGNQYS
jgi:hypothetical protein